MKSAIINILLLSLLAASCSGGKQQGKAEAEQQPTEATKTVPAAFPFPDVPTVLVTPEERRGYLLSHYWDRFPFADTAMVNNREVAEQGLADYLSLLSDETVGEALAVESMDRFCTGLEAHTQARTVFMERVEHYLYHPESPFYHEGLYRLYLERMLKSNHLDEARKSTLRFGLRLVNRNRVGEQAESFTYFLPDGSRRTLSGTPIRGDRLLLVFYDPECHNCHAVLEGMMKDNLLKEQVAAGKVTVLAIYTEGDEEAWKRALPEMPGDWTIGTDRRAIQEHALYDLKAMPTLYLLNQKREVVLKDAPYDRIRQWLARHNE